MIQCDFVDRYLIKLHFKQILFDMIDGFPPNKEDTLPPLPTFIYFLFINNDQ